MLYRATFLASVLSIVSTVHAHGYLTKPSARQNLLDVGLTNPGAGDSSISSHNQMNMNGMQGAVGIGFLCYTECLHDQSQYGTDRETPQCKECLDGLVTEKQTEKSAGGLQPSPRLGVCGDMYDRNAFSTGHAQHASLCNGGDCVTQALASDGIMQYDIDPATRQIEVKMKITTHHYGWSEFRLCKEGGEGATQECFNQHVLEFDTEHASRTYPPSDMEQRQGGGYDQTGDWTYQDPKSPADYQALSTHDRCEGGGQESYRNAGKDNPKLKSLWAPDGSCCNNGGDCGGFTSTDKPGKQEKATRWVFPKPTAADESGEYTVMLNLPGGLECSKGSDSFCTLQWLFMTGNSPDSYPEAFRNCADFQIHETAPEFSSSASPSPLSPSPSPLPSPLPSPALVVNVTAATDKTSRRLSEALQKLEAKPWAERP